MFFINSSAEHFLINHLVYNLSENSDKSLLTCSNVFFDDQQSKTRNIQFTIILNREKQQIITLEMLKQNQSLAFFRLSTWISIYRYLFVSVGGCVLAVITMGIYSSLLFTSTFVFILLVCSVDPSCVHAWVFGIQMLWQTFWHLLIQYREYYLQEPVSIRY